MKEIKKNVWLILLFVSLFFSCSNENFLEEGIASTDPPQLTVQEKQDIKVEFAKALSSVLYSNVDARRVIKTEAVKQFDKNYDVLWSSIKDTKIGDYSFEECISSRSSKKIISIINEQLPLLNILFPEIKMFDINAENYDYTDNELPVAVRSNSKTLLFFAGELTDTIPDGDVPGFNVIVVNENSRVEVNNINRSRGASYKYSFISPSYDGISVNSNTRNAIVSSNTRSVVVNSNLVGDKAINAFDYFNKDDSSINSMALQRDYIYYGITPTNNSGALNYSTSEYISFIEVNPKAYFTIADQTGTESISDDPYIKANSASRKKRDFTQEELINELWTKGAYNLRFEIQLSTNDHPQIIYVPVKPSEIWNFNLGRRYRHSTGFRHSKYTYSIDPNKFTSKRYEFSPYELSFGKWNLSEEALYRYVTILEEDESVEKTTTYQYEVTKMLSSKFNGDIKLELGLGDGKKITGGASTEATSTNTTKETRTVNVTRKEASDNLGSVRIYFYDPIIEAKTSSSQYKMRTYNTGYVTFGISVY